MKDELSYDEMEEISKKMEEHHAYTAPSIPIKERFPKPLIIIGAGGFGREVAEIARRISLSSREVQLLGFVDNNKELQGKVINEVKVLGPIDYLGGFIDTYYVCSIADPQTKVDILIEPYTYNNIPINIIDPKVEIFYGCKLGKGIVIQKGTCLAVNSNIEDHVHINFNCSIGHDVHVGEYSTISPLCSISGNTTIGECCFLGSGVITFSGVKIGDNSKIGAGSVVTKDIPPNVLAIGNPAKVIKRF